MVDFVSGLVTMGYAVAGFFFLKFWAQRRDPFFLAFAIAFWLLAANQALVSIAQIPREERSWVYLLRIVAFACIAVAIIRKNAVIGRRDR